MTARILYQNHQQRSKPLITRHDTVRCLLEVRIHVERFDCMVQCLYMANSEIAFHTATCQTRSSALQSGGIFRNMLQHTAPLYLGATEKSTNQEGLTGLHSQSHGLFAAQYGQ